MQKNKEIILIPLFTLIFGGFLGGVTGGLSQLGINPKITQIELFPTLVHNFQVGLSIILGGIFSLAIISLYVIFINGFSTGFILVKLWGFPNRLELYMNIISHGIIELIAYVLIGVASMYLSYYIFNYIKSFFTKKSFSVSFFYLLKYRVVPYVIVGYVLIVVAAIIEAYVI